MPACLTAERPEAWARFPVQPQEQKPTQAMSVDAHALQSSLCVSCYQGKGRRSKPSARWRKKSWQYFMSTGRSEQAGYYGMKCTKSKTLLIPFQLESPDAAKFLIFHHANRTDEQLRLQMKRKVVIPSPKGTGSLRELSCAHLRGTKSH